MAVRSKCLQPPVAVPTGPTTIATAGASETILVKFLALVNSGVVDRNVSFYINSGSGDLRVALVAVPQQGERQLAVWWVLQPGWLLRWGASSGVVGSVFGAELEGVAD